MARRRAHVPLNVLLNSRRVGRLSRASTGGIDFRYDADWLGWESTFPISLSLPLREDRDLGVPVSHVFENLLPDSDPVRKRIAERVGAAGTDAYDLLTALGHDCVGALQFLPEGMDPGPLGSIEGTAVSDEDIADLIENLASAPLGMGEDEAFRISIAGAQDKTALLRHDGQWYKPNGTSATTHILKPQIGALENGIDLSNSVENEYLCLKLLTAFGVATAKAEIADFGAHRTLIVERFDRQWTRDGRLIRLPQEDFCQALSIPPSRKYQSDGGPGMREIANLLKRSDRPDSDAATFMRACILFWLLGATDGHAKNFSIFLTPGGRFHVTPLYDVLSAQPSLDSNQISIKRFKLAMSVGSNRHYAIKDIVPRHFIQTADMVGFGKTAISALFADLAANAVRYVADVIDALPAGFPEQLTLSVAQAIERRVELLAQAAT